MTKKLIDYFDKPKVISIIADVHQGKSNLIYHLAEELQKEYSFNLYTFGLKNQVPNAKEINSLDELEEIRDSLIFLDEFYSLFDLEDRKKKKQIEITLRLINHNNNILVLVGLPENFKKFISAKIDVCFYKKVKLDDFINGSRVKKNLQDYQGTYKGSKTLNLAQNQVLVFDKDYNLFDVPYLEKYDSKKDNIDIFVRKNVEETFGKIRKGK